MRTANALLLILLGLGVIGAVGGCMVGPNYRPPKVDAAGPWHQPLAGGETAESGDIATWWRQFNDSQLDSLVERAVRSNPDLMVATARVREARAQLGVVGADLWPNVDATGRYFRAGVPSSFAPQGFGKDTNLYQAGFDASWELDVFGGKRRSVEAARADLAAVVFNRQDAQVTLISEVARNYVALRSGQRRLAIARENIEAQGNVLALARDRFKNGVVSSLDAEQAATVLAQTQAQVPTLESDLEAAVHRIEVLLGQRPGSLRAELIGDPAPQPPAIPATPPTVPVGLPSDLLRRRPDIRVAERQLASATAQIGVATADLFPKFSLTGNLGWLNTSTSDWFTRTNQYWAVGPTIQWRIFDANRIRSNIKVQNAKQEQALATYEKTVLGGFEDVENALVAYAKEQVRNKLLRDSVTAADNSLRISRDQYAQGVTNFINVLDAQRSLYQVQDQLAQSDQAVSQNLIALYKAMGGGWESDSREASAASQSGGNG